MDQHAFVRFEFCLLQGVMRGNKDLRNRAGGRPLEVRWDGGDRILMGRHKFGMRATADYTHNAIAFAPAVSICAQLRDVARKFQSRDVLRSTWWRSISTCPLQKVSAI
jgi:hypothetical protein